MDHDEGEGRGWEWLQRKGGAGRGGYECWGGMSAEIFQLCVELSGAARASDRDHVASTDHRALQSR